MRYRFFVTMRFPGQLAMIALLAAAAIGASAQISDPNAMVAGPPKPKTAQAKARTEPRTGDLQWIWEYARPTPNGNAVALRNDERLAALLETSFRQPQAFWGKNVPLADVIPRFLSRNGEVNGKGNRYLMIDGCVPSFCAAHGMLWADMGTRAPLLVFAAVNWTTEDHTTDEAAADYNLWLFPNRELVAEELPLALTQSISDWDARLAAAHRGVPHIAHAILVEPDGQPYPLNPANAGANTLPPQPDTSSPKQPDTD